MKQQPAPDRVLCFVMFFIRGSVEALLVAQLINDGHHVDFYMMGANIAPMTKEFNDGSRKVKTTRYKTVDTMRARYAGLKKAGYTPLP